MKSFLLHSVLRRSAFAGAMIALYGAPSWAATCTQSGTAVALTATVPATLSVPKNTPNGTEIYRSAAQTVSGASRYVCEANSPRGYVNSRGDTPSANPSPIGTTGLAWAWVYNGGVLMTYPSTTTIEGGFTLNNTTYAIAIYKIGPITAPSIEAGEMGARVAGGTTIATLSLSNAIALTEVSCQTPSVSVDLGKQRSSQFGGIGTTIGQKAFNIQLNNCPAGLSGISYRLDPINTAFDATTGVLALDEGGATGVGIQITDDSDKVVSLGEVHQFLSSAPTSNVTIPLKAAYYKTAETVEGGKANASMQFTITYQ